MKKVTISYVAYFEDEVPDQVCCMCAIEYAEQKHINDDNIKIEYDQTEPPDEN